MHYNCGENVRRMCEKSRFLRARELTPTFHKNP